MNKIINSTTPVILLCLSLFVALLIFMLRPWSQGRIIKATISSVEITLGEDIRFVDSTKDAKKWLWEFGNGDQSEEKSGFYKFPNTGRYQIRLRIDNNVEKFFTVWVRPHATDTPNLIKIEAQSSAIQGEKIVFFGVGNDKEWRWEFGESGRVDSRDKIAVYTYNRQGSYQVKLTTDNTQYPITHSIVIYPKYTTIVPPPPDDRMARIAADIKNRLQAIANGTSFNTNYNYILSTYLCGNPNVIINVNENKKNDFYSYCQGLRVTGKNNTVIDSVFVESSDPNSRCFDIFLVMQSESQ